MCNRGKLHRIMILASVLLLCMCLLICISVISSSPGLSGSHKYLRVPVAVRRGVTLEACCGNLRRHFNITQYDFFKERFVIECTVNLQKT